LKIAVYNLQCAVCYCNDHIKTTTLGVTVDNINNATDGKMSAVNAASTVDTFVKYLSGYPVYWQK
jgi:hypothetical protein